VYLFGIEFALFLAVSADSLYRNDTLSAFNYFLALVWVYVVELKILRRFYIVKEKDLKKKFEVLDSEKKKGKRALALSISFLILLSSWGIIAFLTNRYGEYMRYVRSITLALPWFALVYFGWVVYLGYLKRKYVKFLMALVKKKKLVNHRNE